MSLTPKVVLDKKHFVEEAAVIVVKEGNKVYAVNTTNKAIIAEDEDATTVIQSARNALTPRRTWKEKVVLKGNFTVNSYILIPSYTVLEILGKITATTDADILVVPEGATAVDIIGGHLIGNDNPNEAGAGVKVDTATDVRVLGVKAEKFGLHGVWLHKSWDCEVAFCEATDNRQHGILAEGGGRNFIHDNNCWANHRCGILLENNDIFDIVKGNQCWNNEHVGIKVGSKCHRAIIANNRCNNNNFEGIDVEPIAAAGEYTFGVVVEGNVVFSNLWHGILLSGTNVALGLFDCVVANNYVAENDRGRTQSYDGIRLDGAVRKCIVIGNRCIDNDRYEISIESALAEDNMVVNNNVIGTDHVAAIRNTAIRTLIKGNAGYVTENSGTAVFSGDGSNKTFTIPHGLAGAPKSWRVEAGSEDAKGDKYVTADATNLSVTFDTAPPSGTNNVILVWQAEM